MDGREYGGVARGDKMHEVGRDGSSTCSSPPSPPLAAACAAAWRHAVSAVAAARAALAADSRAAHRRAASTPYCAAVVVLESCVSGPGRLAQGRRAAAGTPGRDASSESETSSELPPAALLLTLLMELTELTELTDEARDHGSGGRQPGMLYS